jgi:hypothetical protein
MEGIDVTHQLMQKNVHLNLSEVEVEVVEVEEHQHVKIV